MLKMKQAAELVLVLAEKKGLKELLEHGCISEESPTQAVPS